MFGNLYTCTGEYKATKCGDIKRVFPVASRAYHINSVVFRKVDSHTQIEQSLAKPSQFFAGNPSHPENRQERSNFGIRKLPLGDANQHLVCFSFSQDIACKQVI